MLSGEDHVNLPEIAEDDRVRLIGELAEALDAMVDQSCAEMAPLWLAATRTERAQLQGEVRLDLGFMPSPRYIALGKGSRSKYRALAAWRHAVLWREAERAVEDADFRAAMRAVYFAPFPSNEPPYAWSSSAAGAPGVRADHSAKTLKAWAKEGCAATLKALRREHKRLAAQTDILSEVEAGLLKVATLDTVEHVLKLEDHPSGDLK